MTDRRTRPDLDPFYFSKNAIGFDSIFKKMLDVSEQLPKIPTYPPYNVKKVDDNRYIVEMAVAGFGKQNLDIELKEDVLSITGNVESDEGEYLHRGIANRAFTRKFTIADGVEVKNAELVNGMLSVFLERFVPEEKKPKKIDIFDPFGVGEATKQLLTEGTSSAFGAFGEFMKNVQDAKDTKTK